MNLKQKLINELEKEGFPDLNLVFSDEILDIAPIILDEFLEIDKQKFEDFLKIENKDLTFESFEEESNLDYFWSLLNHLQSVENTEKIRKIIEDFRPKLQDFGNYVAYNKDYFDKLVYVENNLDLDQEQIRIMYLRIKAFKDRGIDLPIDKQDRLKELNKKLSKLSDDFTNNIVDDEGQFEYHISNFEVIQDLPKEVLEITRKFAEEKGLDGYLFDSDPTSYQAIMKYCSDKKIRGDFARAFYSFASNGKYDNRENILNILKLKKEKAEILGYKNYAELSLNSKMAESPKQVFELIEGISKKAYIKANSEINELKAYFKLDKIDSEDLAYYSRIYKEKKYDIDDKELKNYFEFENTLTYLHNLSKEFYGIELIEIESNLEDIRIYEVYKDGVLISYYFLDPFYRKNKRPGAWADNLREKEYEKPHLTSPYQGRNRTIVPIIVNVCNFQKTDGKITLGMRDVETLFHEFGHALHEISSESKYSELSGFGVEWDFVELPSQLLENWVADRESLQKLAKHVDTGESMSHVMLDKLDNLKTYMSGTFVARQNEFALLDMTIYSSEIVDNVEKLDKIVLEIVNKYSIFPRGEDYKMYCSFGHIFGGGYSAGYYSYMWAEIIEADVFSKIKELGMFDRKVGEKFLNTILGQGTRKTATELFFDFMGREVDNTAFMERKGL
ncbi:MAG: M3 family metallopeptidase [Candidatus Gracilibacteria bacterium]|nr:M3 family metallopeptidase [Candidatus Gracilibacteria bacterium]